MTTRELIQLEIDRVGEEHFRELYDLIRHFGQSKREAKRRPLMSKLRSITIDAPEDFAANHDLYITFDRHFVQRGFEILTRESPLT